MTDPFSAAGRFEERSRLADQQRAQEAARARAEAEGREPPEWALPVPDGRAMGTALGKGLAVCLDILRGKGG